ncbi:MAG: EpsI family protein [Armatimonadetes bacterium]|nr:EpsI family protein [Armatimonadota bacterium]
MLSYRWLIALGFPVLLVIGDRLVARQSVAGSARTVKAITIPMKIGDWTGQDLETDPKVVKVLSQSTLVQRSYTNSRGEKLGFSVVFSDGWDQLHPPQNCLKGLGYEITRETTLEFPYGTRGQTAHATILHGLRHDNERIVELYIFTDARQTSPTWMDRHLQMMLQQGRKGGNTTALILVNQKLLGEADVGKATGLVTEFMALVLPHVQQCLRP